MDFCNFHHPSSFFHYFYSTTGKTVRRRVVLP